MKLNDAERVREEYSSEAGLLGRRAAYRWADGPAALTLLFRTIAALRPHRVVEVGELRALVGDGGSGFASAFSGENARNLLAEHFASVDEHDAGGSIRFPDRESVVSYLEASISLKGAAEQLPDLELPFVVRRHPTIFVAQKA